MKYQQDEFNQNLKDRIINTETALKYHTEALLKKYKAIFAKKKLEFNAEFDSVGNNPFTPGYCSSISIGIADENGELDLHVIKIWECNRTFLGLPINKVIPGSKITGELLDESLEDVKLELKEYIEESLAE